MKFDKDNFSSSPRQEKQFPPQDYPPGKSNPDPDKPPAEIKEDDEDIDEELNDDESLE
jgi:hypothetical protein